MARRNKSGIEGPSSDSAGGTAEELREWLDVAAKVLGALAVVAVAWVGHLYQSNLSATTLISQREQSESQLRAGMLHDLVEPIMGRPVALKDIDPQRERLLVELLTLNFHDHFEFKSLLEQVYERQTRPEGRLSLESVARRVIDRQINSLLAVSEGMRGPGKAQFQAFAVDVEPASSRLVGGVTPAASPQVLSGNFTDLGQRPIYMFSPDRKVCLEITLAGPDYKAKSVLASMTIYSDVPSPCAGQYVQSSDPRIRTISDLKLSIFDFPLTDNTELDPRHRFALSLYYMEKGIPVQFKLVWFPAGYVTDRERPLNYTEMRRLLGLQAK